MTPGELVAVGARSFGVSADDLRGSKRGAVSRARQGVAWALRQRFGQSCEGIGRLLCKKHSTIYDGLARARHLRATCPEFRARTDRLLTIEWADVAPVPRPPAVPAKRIKPMRNIHGGDHDALMRLRGTLALERALLAYRAEREGAA